MLVRTNLFGTTDFAGHIVLLNGYAEYFLIILKKEERSGNEKGSRKYVNVKCGEKKIENSPYKNPNQ